MYQADLNHPSPDLAAKLQTLYNLNREKAVDLSFRPPFLDLLRALGNPHQSLPPVIHVAGTNGKGSIIAMLRSILQQGGHQVHAYTSPHLLRFNERIVLAGQEVGDDSLNSLIDEALDLNQGNVATFFEITTAMAFAAFSRQKADFCLLEVGMGGRLDCTNVIEKPAVSVINTIGMDHQEYLGNTLPEIAAEKAGIIKPGVSCVIGPQKDASVMAVFEKKADEVGAKLCRYGIEWDVRAAADKLVFECEGKSHEYEIPSLIGPHQIYNAGTALAALEMAKCKINADHINAGLRNTQWHGRLQNIQSGEQEIWFDGGHNEDAGRVLAAQIEAWQAQDDKRLHLVVGMKKDKDMNAFLSHISNHAESVTIVPIPDMGACWAREDLRETKAEAALSVRDAVDRITGTQKPCRILVCGSLYLAAQFLPKKP